MYQLRNQQQPIVPVSYDSSKINVQQLQGLRQNQPSTFMQSALPIPTQIQQQRIASQQIFQQQEQQQQYDSQQYVNEVQKNQRNRFMKSASPGKMKAQFETQQTFQGGAPPKKAWMGDDVYLVAFLLGVEVERLREENDKLYAERDSVDQKTRALGVVEGELKDARSKMGEYEKRHVLLSSELEGWRSKHFAKEQESEDNRYQQDFQRRITVDREIRELTSKFISDRNYLENENQKLRQDLDELRLKHGSADDIFESSIKIQEENEFIKLELNRFRQNYDELEAVFKTAQDLEQENEFHKEQIKVLQSQGKNGESERLRSLLMENQELKKMLLTQKPSNAGGNVNVNVERLQKELQMYEAENKRLRMRSYTSGGDKPEGAFY